MSNKCLCLHTLHYLICAQSIIYNISYPWKRVKRSSLIIQIFSISEPPVFKLSSACSDNQGCTVPYLLINYQSVLRRQAFWNIMYKNNPSIVLEYTCLNFYMEKLFSLKAFGRNSSPVHLKCSLTLMLQR